MNRKYHRTQQVSELIHRQLAWILQRHIEDPRLKHLTVLQVRVSNDLKYAFITLTQLTASCTSHEVLSGLNKASSRIRYLLAQQINNLRIIPSLRFRYDDSYSKIDPHYFS